MQAPHCYPMHLTGSNAASNRRHSLNGLTLWCWSQYEATTPDIELHKAQFPRTLVKSAYPDQRSFFINVLRPLLRDWYLFVPFQENGRSFHSKFSNKKYFPPKIRSLTLDRLHL
jgi:hypothetical protein